jgi:hypothetical protein
MAATLGLPLAEVVELWNDFEASKEPRQPRAPGNHRRPAAHRS